VIHEASAKRGVGVVETFFALVGRAWDRLDTDRRLSERLGIDSAVFQSALAEHVGVREPGKITG
jgi:hypothetical protein